VIQNKFSQNPDPSPARFDIVKSGTTLTVIAYIDANPFMSVIFRGVVTPVEVVQKTFDISIADLVSFYIPSWNRIMHRLHSASVLFSSRVLEVPSSYCEFVV